MNGKKNMSHSLITVKNECGEILSYSLHEKYHVNDLPLEFASPPLPFQQGLDLMKSSWKGELLICIWRKWQMYKTLGSEDVLIVFILFCFILVDLLFAKCTVRYAFA